MAGFATEAVSEVWLEATVRAATGVAAGRTTAVVASAAVAALTKGVLTMMLLGRLRTIALGTMAACTVISAMVGIGTTVAARWNTESAAPTAQGGQSIDPTLTKAGRWIKGVVVDVSGKPVLGARVSSHWKFNPVAVTTKADGTFVLANDEPRLANLAFLATADGGARQGTFRFQDLAGSKDSRTLVRIVLKPARIVTVTVIDGRGQPVEGAPVCVLDLVFPVADARSDARGVATLRAPADALTHWIIGYKRSVGFDYFENYRSAPPAGYSPPPERARLVLDGARNVRIRAVDSADKPVPGVEFVPITILKKGKLFRVNLSTLPIKVFTDARGVATFDWLPTDIPAGTSFFAASSSYYLPNWPLFEPDKPDVALSARLVRYTRITGKVAHPDGSPASGILVEVAGVGDGSTPASGRAKTTAEGIYSMELPPEKSYMVYVVDNEWAATSLSGIVVREGMAQTGLDLTLERASVIMGRITAGPRSQPPNGLSVMLVEHGPAVPPGTLKNQPNPLSDTSVRIADTDNDGRYSFRIGPGDYELIGPRQSDSEPVREQFKVAGGQQIQKDFVLRRVDRPSRTLRGLVRARQLDGPLIAGAIVVGEAIGARHPPTQGSADDRGRFELPRPFGRSFVYGRNPKGDLAGYATAGEDDENEVTIVAKPAATVRGRVVDSTGKPRAGVTVICGMYPHFEAADGPGGAGQTTVTNAEGQFAIPGLLVGATCKLFAYNHDGSTSSDHRFAVNNTTPIDVGAIVLDPRNAGSAHTGMR
jgi:Carboxypeptidase regulatory-like domain